MVGSQYQAEIPALTHYIEHEKGKLVNVDLMYSLVNGLMLSSKTSAKSAMEGNTFKKIYTVAFVEMVYNHDLKILPLLSRVTPLTSIRHY